MRLRSIALLAVLALSLGAPGGASARVRSGVAVIVVQADPGHLNSAISTG